MSRPHNNKVALILEAGPGFFGLFGIGHMYAGRVKTGLMFLVGYLVVQSIAATVLGFLGIGMLYWLGLTAIHLATLIAATTSVLDEKNMLTRR